MRDKVALQEEVAVLKRQNEQLVELVGFLSSAGEDDEPSSADDG